MDGKNANALLVHIEHSKPIEVSEFVTSLNAVGNLFSSFAQKRGDHKELAQAKLYVEKIEDGCIDITLCETVSASLIPFMENMNIILGFAMYIKEVLEYYTKGIGDKPELDLQECKDFKDLLTVTAGDNNGQTCIGAINKDNKGDVYNGCTFNFYTSNSAQNQIEKEIVQKKEAKPIAESYTRQLMTIYQMRSDMSTNIGNKAVIESISKKKLGVVFDNDELKERILNLDENPAKKAFLVDVSVMKLDGKLVAYNVTALHDVIGLNNEE